MKIEMGVGRRWRIIDLRFLWSRRAAVNLTRPEKQADDAAAKTQKEPPELKIA